MLFIFCEVHGEKERFVFHLFVPKPSFYGIVEQHLLCDETELDIKEDVDIKELLRAQTHDREETKHELELDSKGDVAFTVIT